MGEKPSLKNISKFTCSKSHTFWYIVLGVFDKLLELCNYHHNQDKQQLHHSLPSRLLCFDFLQSNPPQPLTPNIYGSVSHPSRMSYKWKVTYVAFGAWPLSLSVMHLRLIHVIVWISHLLLSSVPVYDCTAACLSIHELKGIYKNAF